LGDVASGRQIAQQTPAVPSTDPTRTNVMQ
jgi:hypothetical protein